MGHATFLPQPPPQLPHRGSHQRAFPVFPSYTSPAIPPPAFTRAHSLPVLPYMPQHTQANIEQLKLSRTVMLRYISKDVSLTELLNEIDVGPIEYCKMFNTTCPGWIRPPEELKSCSISFFNTQTSVFFVLRYAKNQANFRLLKSRLKNSSHLQISLNESVGNSGNNQDLIKIKTFTYIQDNDATRAVSVAVSLDEISEETDGSDPVARVEQAVRSKFARFGDIEHVLVSASGSLAEYAVIIHFTSIDASVKAYEHSRKHSEHEEKDSSPAFEITVKSIAFARDRCDCTEITPDHTQRRKSTHSTSSASSVSLITYKRLTGRSRSQLEEISEDVADVSATEIDPSATKPNNVKSVAKSLTAVTENFEPLVPLIERALLDPYIPEDDLVSVSSSNSDCLLNSIHGDLNDPLTKGTSYLHLGRLAASFLSLNYESAHGHSSSSGASAPMPAPSGVPFVPASAVMHDNAHNRTLFLGNIHPNTTVEEIANNVRAGGLVEWIRSYPAKHICFITFIDPAVALKFYMMHQVYHQLVIHGNEICVKWGKNHLGPLSRDIALAVTAGASRNVYIGYKRGARGESVLPDEDELRRDFSRFGELEQVNIYHKRSCGFVNFLNIADAIDVVDAFKAGDEEKLTASYGDTGEFYAKYSQFNVSFGKDRCGNPLKFSFKKRDPSMPLPDTPQSFKDTSPERLDLINLEAAIVFGISTEEPAQETAESPTRKESKPVAKPGKYEKHYVGAEVDFFEASAHTSPIRKVDGNGIADDLELDSDDSLDDHDDISIIIGLCSPQRKPTTRTQPRHEKVFHNNFNYFDEASEPMYGGRLGHLGGIPASAPVPMSPYAPYPYALYDYRQPLYAPQHSMLYLERAIPVRGYVPEYKPAGFNHRTVSSGSQVMADYLAKSKGPLFYSMNNAMEERRRASRNSRATVER